MDGRGKKNLVAGDCVSNRYPLVRLLKQAQYEVHLAGDGYKALERMFKGGVDAIITDWNMARLKGADFLSLSRILWPKAPAIIVSAHHAPSRGELPRRAFAWINKPYGSEELLQILRTAIQTTAYQNWEQSITAITQR